MKRFLIAALLLGITACLAGAQELVGDWQGKLSAGGVELRLVLHVIKAGDGSLSGTLDSIDQGANGIAMTVHKTDTKVALESSDLHANFDGTLSADGKMLKGTWSQQGQSMPLDLEKTDHPWSAKPAAAAAAPSDIDGRWEGKLTFPTATLRIVFRLTNTVDGLTATVQSPDQSPNEAPVTAIQRNGSSISIQMKQFGADFNGTIDPDHKNIAGNFTQGGQSVPLTLARAKD
jgi:hypothetical protein